MELEAGHGLEGIRHRVCVVEEQRALGQRRLRDKEATEQVEQRQQHAGQDLGDLLVRQHRHQELATAQHRLGLPSCAAGATHQMKPYNTWMPPPTRHRTSK